MFGYSIVGNEDLSGDGISDFVIGAPRAGLNETGKVYVYIGAAGKIKQANLADWTDASTDAIIGSNDYEWLGHSLALGDFDNDADIDIVAGAPRYNSFRGRAYYFYNSGAAAFAADTDNADKTFTGSASGDRFGWSVATADVNNATWDEAVIGAYGANNNKGQAQILRSWNDFTGLDMIEYYGDYAYGVEGNNIVFFDASDDTAPFVVGYIDMGDTVNDIEVYGDFVYALVGTDLDVVDATDKQNPSISSTVPLGYTGIKIVDDGTGSVFFISEANASGTIHRCTNASVTAPAITPNIDSYTHPTDTLIEESLVANSNRVYIINETDHSIISLLHADLSGDVEGIVGSYAEAIGTYDFGVGRPDPGTVDVSGGATVDGLTFTVTNANVNGGNAVTVTVDASGGEGNVAQIVTAINLGLTAASIDSYYEAYANGSFVGFRPKQNTGPLGDYTLTSGTLDINADLGWTVGAHHPGYDFNTTNHDFTLDVNNAGASGNITLNTDVTSTATLETAIENAINADGTYANGTDVEVFISQNRYVGFRVLTLAGSGSELDFENGAVTSFVNLASLSDAIGTNYNAVTELAVSGNYLFATDGDDDISIWDATGDISVVGPSGITVDIFALDTDAANDAYTIDTITAFNNKLFFSYQNGGNTVSTVAVADFSDPTSPDMLDDVVDVSLTNAFGQMRNDSYKVYAVAQTQLSIIDMQYYYEKGSQGTFSVTTTIAGSNEGDYFGYSVAGAGEADGTAGEDMLISAPYAGSSTGYVYLIPGDDTSSSNWTTIRGENPGDLFGMHIFANADVDGNAVMDLVIGAPGYDNQRGKVYTVYSHDFSSPAETDIANTTTYPSSQLNRLEGEYAGDYFGSAFVTAMSDELSANESIFIGAPSFDDGNRAEVGKIYAYLNGIVLDFSVTPTQGDPDLTVAISSNTQNWPSVYDDAVDAYSWDFGDGNTSTDFEPSNTYTASIVYTISLSETSGNNYMAASDVDVTVNVLVDNTSDYFEYQAPGETTYNPISSNDTVELGGSLRWVSNTNDDYLNGAAHEYYIDSTIMNTTKDTVAVTLSPGGTLIRYTLTIGGQSNDTSGFRVTNGETFTLQFKGGTPITLDVNSTWNASNLTSANMATFNTYNDAFTTEDPANSEYLTTSSALTVDFTFTNPVTPQLGNVDVFVKTLSDDQVVATLKAYQESGTEFKTRLTSTSDPYYADFTALGLQTPVWLKFYPDIDGAEDGTADTNNKRVLYYDTNDDIASVDSVWFSNSSTGTPALSNDDVIEESSSLYIASAPSEYGKWIRILSDKDQNEGLLIQLSATPTLINLGLATDQTTNTIEYAVGEGATVFNNRIYATQMDPGTYDDPAHANAPNGGYTYDATTNPGTAAWVHVNDATVASNFRLISPADNTRDMDVFPKLRWSKYDGNEVRGLTDVTYYEVYIAANDPTNTDPTANYSLAVAEAVDNLTLLVNNGGYAFQTRDEYVYLDGTGNDIDLTAGAYLTYKGNVEPAIEGDLRENCVYVWTVKVKSGAAVNQFAAAGSSTTSPVNLTAIAYDQDDLANNEVFAFSTMKSDPSNGVLYPTIETAITLDRKLNSENDYYMLHNPSVAEGVTLTIPDGTDLYFATDVEFVINGNLIASGTSTGINFKHISDKAGVVAPYDVDGTWAGLNFPANPTIARTALSVSEDTSTTPPTLTYNSGNRITGVDIDKAVQPIKSYADVNIDNCTITNYQQGFEVSDGSYVWSNTFDEDDFVTGVSNVIIINGGKYIMSNQIGDLDETDADPANIITGKGIVTSVADAKVYDNTILAIQGDPITVVGGTSAQIAWNEIRNNTGNSITGGNTIFGNLIFDNTGYSIDAETGATVRDNQIFRNGGFAIRDARYILDNLIEDHLADGGTANVDTTLIYSTDVYRFERNTISNNVMNGLDPNALVDITYSTPTTGTFLTNTIQDNETYGYLVKITSGSLNMEENQILNNQGTSTSKAAANDAVALWLDNTSGTATIDNNSIISNEMASVNGAAVYVNSANDLTITGTDIAQNTAPNTGVVDGSGTKGAGVFVNAGNVKIENGNVITYNYADSYPAIYINDGAVVEIDYNVIATNYVYSQQSGDTDDATNLTKYAIYGSPASLSHNTIYRNSFTGTTIDPSHNNQDQDWPNDTSYDFRYTSTADLYAPYNHWGTYGDLSRIEKGIYDDEEANAIGETLGQVTYQPIDADIPTVQADIMALYSMNDGHTDNLNDFGAVVGGYIFIRSEESGNNPIIGEIDAVNVKNLSAKDDGITIYVWEEGGNSSFFRGEVLVSDTETNELKGIIKAQIGDVIRISSINNPEIYEDVVVREGGFTLAEAYILQEDEVKTINLWSAMHVPIQGNYEIEVIGGNHITATVDGYEVTFAPEANWNGSEQFVLNLKDADGNILYTDSTVVRVNEVNDVPLLVEDLANMNLLEDFEPFQINLAEHYIDVEGDPIEYDIIVDEDALICTLEDGLLTIAPVPNWYGHSAVTVLAANPISNKGERAVSAESFSIDVASVNDLPEIVSCSVNDEELYLDLNVDHIINIEVRDVDDPVVNKWWKLDQQIISEADSVSMRFSEYGEHKLLLTISDGKSEVTKEWSIKAGVPAMTRLNNNYPNPFNPRTTIAFDVKDEGRVAIEVFNVKGQKVTTLIDEVMTPGNHTVEWFGQDDNNKKCASGVYYYKMSAKGYSATRKMLLLK